MSYERIKRLQYKRKTASFRLPVFLLDRMQAEGNQTELVELAVMKHLKMEYPKNVEK